MLIGSVKIRFTDGFAEDFINACRETDVNIRNIVSTDDGLIAECPPNEYALIARIARQNGGRVRAVKKNGLVFVLAKLRCRMGLAVGLVLSVCVFSLLSGFIWDVRVVGNETLEASQITDFLASQGLYAGAHWNSVDKRVCEGLVMASFDEVGWVHINRFGTVAQVEINEAEPKPDVTDNTVVANLKAVKDGTIVSAVVYDGWQVAFNGDSVVKGDILVSGVYESEHAQENLFARADGLFIAQTVTPVSHTVAREQKRKQITSVREYKALSFFGIYVPLYLGKTPKNNVDVSESRTYLKINNRPVPIGVITKNITSYTYYSYTMNDDELCEMLKSQVQEKTESLFDEGSIISSDISYSLEADKAVATGEITALEDIGECVEFYDRKNLDNK